MKKNMIFKYLTLPITQNEKYHNFADNRNKIILNTVIPNFNDVLSNAQFVMTSMILMARFYAESTNPYRVFLRALLLVGPASAYYHWNPNSDTLAVDRCAMTAAFGSLFVHAHLGDSVMLWPVVLLSMWTIAYWKVKNDLRPYILLQYGGALSLVCTDCWGVLPLYILAKICERYDAFIFNQTKHTISGHTLKHIFAGLSALFVPVR